MPVFAWIALLCAIAGCSSQSTTADTLATANVVDTVANPNAFWANVGVVFDPDSVTVGDTIGSLVVSRVAVHKAYDSSAVGSVAFSGPLDLRGQLIAHFDSDIKTTCFEADSLSATRMPRWKGDSRRPWFCFRGEAGESPPTSSMRGPATIRVDNFTIHFTMSDAVNNATLRQVVTTTKR